MADDDENWDEIASPKFELDENKHLSDVEFGWDENKRLSNVEKHGIDFVDCLDVFLDPDAFMYRSMRSQAEQRYVIVGRAGERSMGVVFTKRGSLIRLISARASRRNERRQYEAERQKKD
jgi:uncharacterized DUF497 family protein